MSRNPPLKVGSTTSAMSKNLPDYDDFVAALDDTMQLYLRANNQFAADMEEYVETGELLDVDVGHHTQYI